MQSVHINIYTCTLSSDERILSLFIQKIFLDDLTKTINHVADSISQQRANNDKC